MNLFQFQGFLPLLTARRGARKFLLVEFRNLLK